MKKYLSKFIKNHYKTIFKSLVESNSKYLSINKLEIELKKNCKLGKNKEKIYLIPDEIMTPFVLKNNHWDYEIIKFIKKYKIKKNNVFLDIGSNIGLVSKQLIEANIKINKFLCFEPNKNSFECLKLNLSSNNKVNLYNFGLGLKNQNLKLYKNKMNSGDSSFIKKKVNFEICIIKNINSFFKKNNKILDGKKLIYKSDTQGMDEEIFVGLKEKYFDNINIAIIEISNHKFINKNKKKFYSRLQSFKIMNDKNLKNLKINQIENKINNKEEFDLFLRK
tara:strand:- start:3678 stop:4511 length:834 start_codon:yes stop_codon:yes gene_type:complete